MNKLLILLLVIFTSCTSVKDISTTQFEDKEVIPFIDENEQTFILVEQPNGKFEKVKVDKQQYLELSMTQRLRELKLLTSYNDEHLTF